MININIQLLFYPHNLSDKRKAPIPPIIDKTKAIEVFSLDADYFLQPIDHVDNIVYQNSKTAGVKSVESIVNKVAEAYEAQIKLLREKIERLENE